MEIIKLVSGLFLIILAFGTQFFSGFINPLKTGSGLFKVTTALSAGFLGLATLTWGQLPFNNTQGALLLLNIGLLLMGYFLLREERKKVQWGIYALQLLAFSSLFFELFERKPFPLFFFFSSLLLLGSVFYAMVLGHWYLVVPKLSEKLLKKIMTLMGGALVLRVALTLWGVKESQDIFDSEVNVSGDFLFNGILLAMRVLWGELAILILGIFSWRLVGMRSIQSATGILYVMVFFVFIGELISIYFYYNLGSFL